MSRAAVLALAAAVSIPLLAACRNNHPAQVVTPGAQVSTAAAQPAAANAFTGDVAETMNSGGYTYARLQAPGKEDVWIAASEFSTKAGDRLTVTLDMPMRDFESKTLARTFPLVYFVSGVKRDGEGAAGLDTALPVPALMTSHAPAAVQTTVEPIPPPAGGLSIADLWAKRTGLAGREVTVRGKVVKMNEQIMGRNWIHLQDGSGSSDARTNDLTITTAETIKVGDVVTIAGVLAVDKDFGAGYAYGALLENGKVIK